MPRKRKPDAPSDRRPNKPWLNVKDAADYLGISRQTLYKLMASGKLRYYEVEGVRGKRLLSEDLDALFRVVEHKR